MKKRQYLAIVRYAKGYTQTELASLLGISQPYLSQLESLQSPCPEPLLNRIAAKLETDVQELRRNLRVIEP